jgi:hypothetical protein
MPGFQADRYPVGGDLMQEGEADTGIATLGVIEFLTEEVGFTGRAQTYARWGGFVIGSEPTLGADD